MHFKRVYYLFFMILMAQASGLKAHAFGYASLSFKRIVADSDSVFSNVFLRVTSAKKSVHVGEPFMVKYALYTAIQVVDPETNVDVKFNNSYQEEFSVDTSLLIETINGKRYSVVNLKQYLVIANNAGKMVLPSIKIQLGVNEVDTTGFFRKERLITKDIISPPGVVIVEKLPVNKDSILFSGAVGKFRIVGAYTPAKRSKNMIVFHLVIDGTGNTKAAAITLPHFQEGLEVYNANTIRHDSVTNYGIKTHFEYTFQVVANYRGKYNVPPVVFNVYDPDLNKFESFSLGPYNWQVDKGPEMPVQTTAAHKQANELFYEKQLYARTNEIFSYSVWYYILLAIGLLLALYSYFREYFNRLILSLVEYVNNRTNKYLALRSIDKLITDASTLDDDIFWKRLGAILYRYIKGEANIPQDSVSDLSLDTTVLSNAIPADLYQQVILYINGLQSVRFNAVKSAAVDKVQSCNQLIKIVNALDTNWHE